MGRGDKYIAFAEEALSSQPKSGDDYIAIATAAMERDPAADQAEEVDESKKKRIAEYERRTGMKYTGQPSEGPASGSPIFDALSHMLEQGASGFGEATKAGLYAASVPERLNSVRLFGPDKTSFASAFSGSRPTRTEAASMLLPPIPLLPLAGQTLLGTARGHPLEGLASGWEQTQARVGSSVLGVMNPDLGREAAVAAEEEGLSGVAAASADPSQGMQIARSTNMSDDAGRAMDLIAELLGAGVAGKAAKGAVKRAVAEKDARTLAYGGEIDGTPVRPQAKPQTSGAADAPPEGPRGPFVPLEDAFHETEQAARVAKGDLKGTAVVEPPTKPADFDQFGIVKDAYVDNPNAGKPLRVFHGSGESYEAHDVSKVKGGLYNEAGEHAYYFAESPEVASRYADDAKRQVQTRTFPSQAEAETFARTVDVTSPIPAGPGDTQTLAWKNEAGRWDVDYFVAPKAQVRPTYLNIKNPFPADGPVTGERLTAIGKALKASGRNGIAADRYIRDGKVGLRVAGKKVYDDLADVTGNKAAANKVLRAAGYDGILHGGQRDGRVWIAFSPEQVVSLPDYHAAHGTAPPKPSAGELGLPPEPPRPPPSGPPPPPGGGKAPGSPVGGSGGPPGSADPSGVLTELLKAAKRSRVKTEKLYAQERGQRFAQFKKLRGAGGGEAGARRAMASLSGELPKDTFEPIRHKMTQAAIDGLYDRLAKAKLPEGIDAHAIEGLNKLLDPNVMVAPQRNEILALARVFKPEDIKYMLQLRPGGETAIAAGVKMIGLHREIMTALYDLSYIGRQGVQMSWSPQYWKSIPKAVRALGSERAYQNLHSYITDRPSNALHERVGLAIPPKLSDRPNTFRGLGKEFKSRLFSEDLVEMGKREENRQVGLAETIPYVGKLYRASNRANDVFIGALRADRFDDVVRDWESGGYKPSMKELHALAEQINSATGRGSFGSSPTMAMAVPLANQFIWSPKLLKSRVDLLNIPRYFMQPKKVRVEAMKRLVGTTAAMLSVVMAVKFAKSKGADVDVETDLMNPSSDLFKVRTGNARFDIAGGEVQLIRAIAQSLTGRKKTAGYVKYDRDRSGPWFTYLRNKLAPMFAAGADTIVGKTSSGEELSARTYLEHLGPMILSDIHDAVTEHQRGGITDTVAVVGPIASHLGFGFQAYQSGGEEARRDRIRLGGPNDPVAKELIRLNTRIADTATSAVVNGKKFAIQPKTQAILAEMSGMLIYSRLGELMKEPWYAALDDEEKSKEIADVIAEARKAAREAVFEKRPLVLPADGKEATW